MAYYPTRMHEILGVEPGEKFTINSLNCQYAVNPQGELIKLGGEFPEASGFAYRRAINCGITRGSILTDEQISKLKALYELDMRWLIRTCVILATHGEPTKIKGSWVYQWDGPFIDIYKITSCLDTLNYTSPINIAELLEKNGVLFAKEQKSSFVKEPHE